MPDFTLLNQAIAEGTVAASLRGPWLMMHEHNPELAERTLVQVMDSAASASADAGVNSPVVENAVSSFASADEAAEAHAIPLTSVARLAEIEQQIAAAAQPPSAPPVPNAPWLDARPLPTPPEPWNDAHFERDVRRAEAADLKLSRDTWELYAEMGLDAVTELWNERSRAEVRRLADFRDTYLATEQSKLYQQQEAQRAVDAVAAQEAERQRLRDAERQRAIAATRNLGLTHPLDV